MNLYLILSKLIKFLLLLAILTLSKNSFNFMAMFTTQVIPILFFTIHFSLLIVSSLDYFFYSISQTNLIPFIITSIPHEP
jgi:hypothetical protein